MPAAPSTLTQHDGRPAPGEDEHHLIIGRRERDALCAGLLRSLTGLSDIYICWKNGEASEAKRRRTQFEGELLLLDDLGWEEEPAADRFDLRMAPDRLSPILERIYWDSAGSLADPEVIGNNNDVEHLRQLVMVCPSLLARLTV